MPRHRAARRRTLLAGLTVLTAILALVVVATTGDSRSAPGREPVATRTPTSSPQPGFAEWSPTYMADDHEYTREEAVALARRVDLIASLPTAFGKYADAMRAANPHLVLLVYTNAMLLPPALTDGVPDTWFAKDDQGNRIRDQQFGQYLMDAGQQGWRAYSAQECTAKVQRTGSDGCMVDMLTMGVFAPHYLSSPPQGSTTRPDVVQARYQQNLVRLAHAFARLPGVVIGANTVTSPSRYFAHKADTRAVAAVLPLNQSEDFMRGARDAATAFPRPDEWRDDVAVLQDLTRLGSKALVTTKLWVPASAALSRQWQRFSMASFLLGAGRGSYYAYTSERTSAGATGQGNSYHLPSTLGQPVSDMVTWQRLYARPFTGGLALVNPTSSPVRASLPSPLHSWDGEDVQTVVVPPHDGTVLLGTTPNLRGVTRAPAPTDVPAPTALTVPPPTRSPNTGSLVAHAESARRSSLAPEASS